MSRPFRLKADANLSVDRFSELPATSGWHVVTRKRGIEMLFFLALSSLGIFFSILYIIMRNDRFRGYYTETYFLALLFFFYMFVIALELAARGQAVALLGGTYPIHVFPWLILLSFFMPLLAIITFYAIIHIPPLRKGLPDLQNRRVAGIREVSPILYGLGGVTALSFMIVGMHLLRQEGLFFSYTASSRYVYGTSSFSAAYAIFNTSGAVLGAYLLSKEGRADKIAGFLIISLIVAISLCLLRKAGLILGLLAIAAVAVRKIEGRGIIFAASFGGVVTIFPLIAISRLFGMSGLSWDNIVQSLSGSMGNFSFLNFEPGGPYYTFATVIHEKGPFLWGKEYLDTATVLIPRFIWPERPASITDIFAQQHMPDWVPHMGFAFSSFAEGYINFGTLGAVFQYALLGVAWCGLWAALGWWRAKFRLDPAFIRTLYYVLGYYMLLMFVRGYIMGWLKLLLLVVCPIFVAITLACMGRNAIESRRRVQ